MSWFWTSGELWDNSEPMYLPSPDPFEHTNETLLTANEQKTGNNDRPPPTTIVTSPILVERNNKNNDVEHLQHMVLTTISIASKKPCIIACFMLFVISLQCLHSLSFSCFEKVLTNQRFCWLYLVTSNLFTSTVRYIGFFYESIECLPLVSRVELQ